MVERKTTTDHPSPQPHDFYLIIKIRLGFISITFLWSLLLLSFNYFNDHFKQSLTSIRTSVESAKLKVKHHQIQHSDEPSEIKVSLVIVVRNTPSYSIGCTHELSFGWASCNQRSVEGGDKAFPWWVMHPIIASWTSIGSPLPGHLSA